MDETLERLSGYVAHKDARLACAAAVVLTELAPREAIVTHVLAAALLKADVLRRPFIVEALGRIGTPQAADALVPLIKNGGTGCDEALRAIAHTGVGALKPLAAVLKSGVSNELRAKLAEAIARTGEAQGFAALFAELKTADVGAARSIREGVHRAVGGLDENGREALLRQALKALDTSAFVEHEDACLVALELVGDTGAPEAVNELQRFATLKAPPRLRRAALLALARLKLTTVRRGKLAARVLPLLEETDLSHSVEPALAALHGGELSGEHRAALERLAASSYPGVRAFAMQALAASGSAKTLDRLVACLEDADPGVRENAASALEIAPGASVPVAERLIKTQGGAVARLAARILQAQGAMLPPRTRSALADEYIALASGAKGSGAALDARQDVDEKRTALLSVLRGDEDGVLAERATQAAHKLRQTGEDQRALGLLKSIVGVAGWGDEQRLELALAGLSVVPLALSRSARAMNHSLRLMEEVLGSPDADAPGLAKRLLKDQAVERKVLYYLGHHCCELMQAAREFGRVLLQDLAGNPRTDIGRQAKEKLVLEGLVKSQVSKTGILEERAKVMMAAADMAAQAAADESQHAQKIARAATATHEAAQAEEQRKNRAGRRALARNTVLVAKLKGQPARKK